VDVPQTSSATKISRMNRLFRVSFATTSRRWRYPHWRACLSSAVSRSGPTATRTVSFICYALTPSIKDVSLQYRPALSRRRVSACVSTAFKFRGHCGQAFISIRFRELEVRESPERKLSGDFMD